MHLCRWLYEQFILFLILSIAPLYRYNTPLFIPAAAGGHWGDDEQNAANVLAPLFLQTCFHFPWTGAWEQNS